MEDIASKAFATRAIHAGTPPEPETGARQFPVFQTTSFVFPSPEEAAARFNLEKVGYIYSRLTNPTVGALEARVAALEGGPAATATSSGHAAQIMAFFPLMGPGDHIVAARKLYGGSINQMTHAYKKFGWEVTFVDFDRLDDIRAALTPKTKALFCESLANPGGSVTDLEAVAAIAHEAGVPLVVDNTLATPYLCRPLEHGADIVVNSTTKFLTGNGTSIGGVVTDSGKFDWAASGKYPSLAGPSPEYHGVNFAEACGPLAYTFYNHAIGLRDLGACQSPQNAFHTLLGIETLPLRMDKHCANAVAVARHLEGHEKVAWVSYVGLESSQYQPLVKKYLPKGAGAVFTFGLKGGYDAGISLIKNVELFSLLANVGDIRSLIIHPASTTHRQVPEEQLPLVGAGPEVVRLSVGCEDLDDIIADLDQALDRI